MKLSSILINFFGFLLLSFFILPGYAEALQSEQGSVDYEDIKLSNQFVNYYQEFIEDSSRFKSRHRVVSFEEFIHVNTPQPMLRNIEQTPPPNLPRAIAEWEPNQGVIIRGHTSGGQGRFHIPFSVIEDFSNHFIVYVICESGQQSTISSTLTQNNVNMSNVEFINVSTNSQWTRDYTPWFIEYGENNEIGMVNFEYDRPRPADNALFATLEPFFDIDVFSMPMRHTGGNYMTDGYTSAVSTEHIYEDNWDVLGIPQEDIHTMFDDYLGIENYYLVYDALELYIKHIDCWAKFLSPDKILILEVPESDSRYGKFEEAAEFWANEISPYGNKYTVYRVFTQPGTDEAYANSLIMNDRVYVPIRGGSSSDRDDAAIAVYEEAMPGYTIIGVINDSGSTPWYDTDALHCRTYQVPDMEMLKINHLPFIDTVSFFQSYNFEAEIYSIGGANIIEESVLLHYRVNGGNFESTVMNNTSDNTFSIDISGFNENDVVEYYIAAENNNNRLAFHPVIGEPDPHKFVILCGMIDLGAEVEQCGGEIILYAGGDFQSYYWNGEEGTQTYTVTNSGLYTVVGHSEMGCSVTDSVYISLLPGAPITDDEHSCGAAEISLSASAEGTVNWYDSPESEVSIFTGNELTDYFEESQTYYVEAVNNYDFIYNVGNVNSESFGGNHTNNSFYLEFDAYTNFLLQSVEVNASGSGHRIIELRNSESEIIEAVSINIPNGVSRINIDFAIEEGTGYQLRCGTGNPNLWRSDAGVNYPYVIEDVVSITGSNAGEDWYYYFYDWEVEVNKECISARVPISAFIYDQPSVNLGSNIEQCGGSVILNAGYGHENYFWNGTEGGQFFEVTETGSYSVVVENSNACTAEDEVFVIIHPEISVETETTDESEPGAEDGTATVIVSGGSEPFSYLWSNGGETETIDNLEGGVYFVTVTDVNNCETVAAAYINTESAPPIGYFSANVTQACNELNVSFIDQSINYPTEWLWDFGDGNTSSDQNPEHLFSQPGQYSVSLTVTNEFGDDFVLKNNYITIGETPEFSIFTSPASGETSNDGVAWIDIFAGMPPYDIYWSTGETAETIYNLLPGIYSVMVKDAYNCIATKPFIIEWTTTSVDAIEEKASLYPNPASSKIFINSLGTKFEIIDVKGQVLISEYITNQKTEVNVTELKPGFYFVRIFFEDSIINKKLIIK